MPSGTMPSCQSPGPSARRLCCLLHIRSDDAMEIARPGSVWGRQQAFYRNISRGLQPVRATSFALYPADIGSRVTCLAFSGCAAAQQGTPMRSSKIHLRRSENASLEIQVSRLFDRRQLHAGRRLVESESYSQKRISQRLRPHMKFQHMRSCRLRNPSQTFFVGKRRNDLVAETAVLVGLIINGVNTVLQWRVADDRRAVDDRYAVD